ncbi:restriction endonuclease subunit S [Hominiventricola filiformis]|uniref:Restriction endonuclease subunit S n=1 Tax=Hominiventricola filiformis TaxID=2885352 RepID=A0AAE3A763_9FIRM|nr:restriction endonuclease subunit S [Hominiventricola filiformis]MCC2127231.1 restriction endonuclease subunit S [Hominiventricola filiformis]
MGKPKIRFKGYTEDWEQRKVSEMFMVTRGYVLPATDTSEELSDEMPYPVYSSQTKDNGLMGYYSDYLYEDAITWTTDGANAGTVNFRDGKFYCTNVCGVLLSDKVEASKAVAEVLNNVAKRYVSYVGNPKLMNNVMADIQITIPTSREERARISSYFSTLDHLITLHQRKILYGYEKVAFVWEQRKLGEMVIDHNAGIYISKEDYGEGTNVIGVGNIYDRDIFDGEIYRLGPVNDDKFILEENDIIYGESSLVPEGIARTVCVGKNGAGSAFAWHTRRVKLDKNIVNSHVATLELNYLHEIRKYLVSVSTQTALTGMTTEGYFGTTLTLATVYKGNIIKNLIMDCQSYTKYRPNETTGGIFVSWRRKEELPTGA